jgi:hypothetical protein
MLMDQENEQTVGYSVQGVTENEARKEEKERTDGRKRTTKWKT